MSVNKKMSFNKLSVIALLLVEVALSPSQGQAQGTGKSRGDRITVPGSQSLQQPTPTDPVVPRPPLSAGDSRTPTTKSPDDLQRSTVEQSVKKEVSFGDFKFTATLPAGWLSNESGGGLKRAEAALAGDGAQLPPVFAFSGTSGGVVYGTLQVLAEGSYFPASSLRIRKEEMLPEWKAPAEALTTSISRLKGQLSSEFSFSTIVSKGDGLLFDPQAVGNTIGVWIAIPVVYKNSQGYQSVIVEFNSRVTDSTRAEANAILQSMIETISLHNGAVVNVDEYMTAHQASQAAAKNKISGGNTALNKPTPAVNTTSAGVTPSAMFSSFVSNNVFLLQSLFEKGSPFVLAIRVDPKTGEAQFVNAIPAAPNR
jgi:hypothetical protein